jgi:hypothetical protein
MSDDALLRQVKFELENLRSVMLLLVFQRYVEPLIKRIDEHLTDKEKHLTMKKVDVDQQVNIDLSRYGIFRDLD